MTGVGLVVQPPAARLMIVSAKADVLTFVPIRVIGLESKRSEIREACLTPAITLHLRSFGSAPLHVIVNHEESARKRFFVSQPQIVRPSG